MQTCSATARSTNYSGGYAADHPTVQALWEAVGEFSEVGLCTLNQVDTYHNL
jgi:muconolactone delta-isomerase